jgi:S1-C subfamily serine protease
MSDPTTTLESLSTALAGLVARAAPGVVALQSRRARSSGLVWKPGLVVTADEPLAEDGDIIAVLPGGERVAATLAGRDPTTDVALLRVAGASPVPGAPTPPTLAAGCLVAALGARDGAPVAALGAVSFAGGAWRSMRGGGIDARIELDIALRREAEGGPVLDVAGGLLGMAVFGPRGRVLVIPAATIDRVAARLETHGRIARGYLGLSLQPVRLGGGGVGAMVMGVEASGPGAQAGVRQGDVITAWDGRPVESVPALLRALGPDSVGSTVKLSLQRGGQPVEVALTIAERPQG